jgi:hypothetical protein
MEGGGRPSRDGLIHGSPTWTAANRAAAEERTAPFSARTPLWRRITVRTEELTGVDVVYRWAAHEAQTASVVHPPFAGFNTGLAPLFKLLHVIKAHGSTVYIHVRQGTVSSIEDIVLCCGGIDGEAQNSRSCQTSASKGHHNRLHPQSRGCMSASLSMRSHLGAWWRFRCDVHHENVF